MSGGWFWVTVFAGGLGTLLTLAFVLFCVLDVALTEAGAVRNLPKLVWLLLIVVLPIIGGIAWLVAGRPAAAGPRPGGDSARRHPRGTDPWPRGRPGRPPRRPSRPAPRGPDDDPEFLRSIDERLRRRDDDGG